MTQDRDRFGPDEDVHEVQLSGKQIVFLFMAATVVAVVVFLFGVWVGRGVEARRAAGTALPAPAAATGPAGLPAPVEGGSPARGETLSYPERLQSETPVEERVAPPPAPVPDTPAGPETPASPAAGPAEEGWVVQVAALRDRDAALAIVTRLTGKHYPAFLLEPERAAPVPSYRVRVGRYRDRAEAERVARRLEREEGFKPFVTR